MIFILILMEILCNMMLYMIFQLRTISNPADIIRFQSHTEKIFLFSTLDRDLNAHNATMMVKRIFKRPTWLNCTLMIHLLQVLFSSILETRVLSRRLQVHIQNY